MGGRWLSRRDDIGEFSEIEKMFKGKKSRCIRNLSRLNKIGRVTSTKMKPKDQEDPRACQEVEHSQEKVGSQAEFREVFATQRLKTEERT